MDHIYGFLLQVHSDLLSGISEITGPGYGRITSGLDESMPITYAAEPFVCRLILVKGAMGLIQKFRFDHHRELKTSVTHQKKCREHEDPTELTCPVSKTARNFSAPVDRHVTEIPAVSSTSARKISLRLWIATSPKYTPCRPRFFNIKASPEIQNTARHRFKGHLGFGWNFIPRTEYSALWIL